MMVTEVCPEFSGEAYRCRRAVHLTLYLPDADVAWAKASQPVASVIAIMGRPLGGRYGDVEDPLGFGWAIATHF